VAEERELVRVGSGKGYDKLAVVGPCSVITSIWTTTVRVVAEERELHGKSWFWQRVRQACGCGTLFCDHLHWTAAVRVVALGRYKRR